MYTDTMYFNSSRVLPTTGKHKVDQLQKPQKRKQTKFQNYVVQQLPNGEPPDFGYKNKRKSKKTGYYSQDNQKDMDKSQHGRSNSARTVAIPSLSQTIISKEEIIPSPRVDNISPLPIYPSLVSQYQIPIPLSNPVHLPMVAGYPYINGNQNIGYDVNYSLSSYPVPNTRIIPTYESSIHSNYSELLPVFKNELHSKLSSVPPSPLPGMSDNMRKTTKRVRNDSINNSFAGASFVAGIPSITNLPNPSFS